MEDEKKDIPYADSAGLLRGLKFGIPLALVLWAIILGIVWLIFAVV